MSDGQVTFATLGKAVGFVLQIDGGVRAQSIDGQERVLKVGDPVFYGETVVSQGSGSAVIEFIDGNHIVIGNKSIVELTDEVFTEKESEELVAEAAAEAEALREAIIAGLDPTQIQDAPAAGETSAEQGIATDVDVVRDNTFSLPEYGYDTDNAFPEDEDNTREIEANADQTADEGGDLAVGVGGANVGFVNAVEASSVSGTLTGVDADVVSITVTYTDGTNQISVAATQVGGVWSTGATDISSLNDGTVNVTAVVTDATGNIATVGDTFTLDTVIVAGTVTVDAITSDDVIDASEASSTVSVTGTATGGDISSGDTVTLIINGTTYTTSVAGDNTWAVNVAGSDLAADTVFDVVVSSSDAAGNTVSSTGSSTHTLDSSALQVNLDIDPITDDSILNATEVAADVVITGNVTGDEFDSGVITLTVNGTNYTGNLVNGAFAISVPGSVLSADSDTTVDASVVVTNGIGQEGTADSTEKYFVDTSARATIRVDSITSDDIINASESQSTVSVTGRVGFDAQAGDTVTLEVNGTTYTTTVAANRTWSVDVAGSDLAQDTSFQASVSGQDSAGNTYTGTTTSTHTVKFEAFASFTSTSATEDDASVSFVVTLNNAAQTDITITTNHGNIIIAAGETTGTLVVDTQDSDVYLDASTITATINSVVGGNFANLDLSTASTAAQITDTIDTTTVSL
ncbi:hypothetical protein TW85_20830, partial [Marinomonas sp. S3726]|uniref:retention module-containing protein n=1 Tax=Marinomonas sp. S3726 TaxID=579484 RepID=UPI0005FA0DFD